jgi:hypothetical protein
MTLKINQSDKGGRNAAFIFQTIAMLTIKGLTEKFRTLNTDTIIDDSFYETKSDFEQQNISQMKAGLTNKGKKIQPKYKNSAYAAKKFAMNAAPGFGTPDLLLTGAFQSQINAQLEGDTIKEFSNDQKGPMLEKKYDDIFGLGGDYKKDWLKNKLGPAVFEKITNFTGLSFSR